MTADELLYALNFDRDLVEGMLHMLFVREVSTGKRSDWDRDTAQLQMVARLLFALHRN